MVFALLPLAPHGEDAALAVEILVIDPDQFASADPCGVEEFEHGAVADAEGIGDVGHGEHGVDFANGERLRQDLVRFARQLKIGGRVGVKLSAAGLSLLWLLSTALSISRHHSYRAPYSQMIEPLLIHLYTLLSAIPLTSHHQLSQERGTHRREPIHHHSLSDRPSVPLYVGL